MALKSSEATIDFLLTCMDCTEGKTDWEQVATKTGWYKAGKFSRQAFTNIQKKYAGTEIGGANTGAAKVNTKDVEKPKKTTSKASKKRAAEDDVKERKGRVKKAKNSETPAPVEDEDGDGGESEDGSVEGAPE